MFIENLKNSLNLATMTSSGIWQCRKGEGEAKQFALANASKCGVTAAYMAQHFTKAPIDMIEGQLGFLKGFAKEKGYKMVLTYSKANPTVLFADESLDVTKEVVTGLNEAYAKDKK